jgi:hypothetical protein
MGEVSDRFRARARECRKLADAISEGPERNSLNEIADDLEEEADKLDAEEEATRPNED